MKSDVSSICGYCLLHPFRLYVPAVHESSFLIKYLQQMTTFRIRYNYPMEFMRTEPDSSTAGMISL